MGPERGKWSLTEKEEPEKDVNKGGEGQRKGCRENQRGKQRSRDVGNKSSMIPQKREGFQLLLRSLMRKAQKRGEDGRQPLTSLTSVIPWVAGKWKGSRDIQASLLLNLSPAFQSNSIPSLLHPSLTKGDKRHLKCGISLPSFPNQPLGAPEQAE